MDGQVDTLARLTGGAERAGLKLDSARPPEQLVGGASPRQYWRCWLVGHAMPVIGTVAPRDAVRAEHGASDEDELERWVRLRDALAVRDVPVPAVLGRPNDGVVFVEDLGDVRVFERWEAGDAAEREAVYKTAVRLLVAFQAQTVDLAVKPHLDQAAMRAELDEFRAMGLEHRHGITLTAAERAVWDAAVAEIVAPLAAAPARLAHRDFQSQNLMVTPRGLVLIDFQDAFMAPSAYDWVALLRDSYIALPDGLRAALVAEAPGDVRALFPFQTLQRKLKDAGRFVTLAERGKPWFLQWFPQTIRYVEAALVESGAAPRLLDLLRTRIPELQVGTP